MQIGASRLTVRARKVYINGTRTSLRTPLSSPMQTQGFGPHIPIGPDNSSLTSSLKILAERLCLGWIDLVSPIKYICK